MKLTRQFDCYPRNFTEEIEATGEKVNVLYGSDIIINFPEIIVIKTPIVDGEEVIGYDITYKKVTCSWVDVEGEQVWQCVEDDTYDGDALIANSDSIIAKHDCNCKLSKEEKDIAIQEENTAILWAEVQRLKGDI
jgi:hypothetical protein